MRFDLHIHSNYSSDSNSKIDDILKEAVKKGLDGIAICDHNTVEGSLIGKKRAKELGISLIVISGIEVSTTEGHLIVLGIKEDIKPYLTPDETIKIAKEKGGLVIAAHPFKNYTPKINNVDAIETFNSRCLFNENENAKEIAKNFKIPEVGGSDSHFLSTIGLGYTDIEINEAQDENSILNAIKEGKTKASGRITPISVIIIMFLRKIYRKFKLRMN